MLGDQRQNEDRLEGEVAVAGDIQAVGRDPVEAQFPGHEIAIDRQAGAGQGRGAQRQDVQPLAAIGQPRSIALELLDIGQEIVRGQHRLGPLHVGVAGQDQTAVPLAARPERRCKADQARVDPVERLAGPEFEVGGDLVVAASRRVQLAADIAQLLDQGRLDVHVDIFALQNERKMPGFDLSLDFRQSSHNLLAFVDGEQTDC